ncbi:MAG: UbiD family decarboxylase [Pyrinomonadaceae bacterium]|nr:UbiD family decarboxylase [Pyrinomonadaceae bacterium]
MHKNLRSFLEVLRRENELIEINAEVDAYLELSEIHRRVIENQGAALLFTNVKGSKFPVVTNLFGTIKRIELAFGKKPQDFVRKAVEMVDILLPPNVGKLWGYRDMAFTGLKLGTKSVRRAPILEVVDQPANLNDIPILTTWQEDGGAFVTLPLVYTESTKTGKHNLGMYRIQRHDAQTTGVHWQIGKGGGFHNHEAELSGEALPVNVVIGGAPAMILAAIAPLPEDVPELMLASLLADGKITTAKCIQ